MKSMTTAQIKIAAPAALAVGRDETRTTDAYAPLSTRDAIKFLAGEGYAVTGAKQMFARKKDNNYTRHMVMLTHEDHMGDDVKGMEVAPRILLSNSHNGTTALKLQAGFFRFVCSNGLIVGDTVSMVKLRHNAPALDILNEQLQHTAAICKQSGDTIEQWKKRKMTKAQQQTFAQKAINLRTRSEDAASFYEPEAVLHARRDADLGDDLWTVFNRVQENLIQGGVTGLRSTGRVVTLRSLTNIRRETEFNQALWNLAAKVAA